MGLQTTTGIQAQSPKSPVTQLEAKKNIKFFSDFSRPHGSNAEANLTAGSPTATFSATRGASNPSSTIRMSDVALIWDTVNPFSDYTYGTSMCVFNSLLYIGVGSTDASEDAAIWVYDGDTFVKAYTFETGAGKAVNCLKVHDGNLYAGLGSGCTNAGDIYVSDGTDVTTWTKSYENSTYTECVSLESYKGNLYAGMGSGSSGMGDVLEFDGLSWASSYDGPAASQQITCLQEMNGYLFAGRTGASDGDARILKFDGATWTEDYDGTSTKYKGVNCLCFFKGEYLAGMYATTGSPATADILKSSGAGWSLMKSIDNGSYSSTGPYFLQEHLGSLIVGYEGSQSEFGQPRVVNYNGTTWVSDVIDTDPYSLTNFHNRAVNYNGDIFTCGQSYGFSLYSYSTPQLVMVEDSDLPRYTHGHYTGQGFKKCRGMFLERASTNVLTYSEEFTNVAWTATSLTVDDQDKTTTPLKEGISWVPLITATAPDATLTQAYTDAVAGVYTASVWLKRKVGGGDVSLRANTADSYTVLPITTSWGRYQVSSSSATNPTFDLKLSVDYDSVWIWGAQLEKKKYATTYIPTTSTALSRNGEILSYATSGNRGGDTEAIFVKFTPISDFANDGQERNLLDNDGAGEKRKIKKNSASSKMAFYPRDTDATSVSVSDTEPASTSDQILSAVALGGAESSTSSLYFSGGPEDTGTVAYTAPTYGTNFFIGSDASGGEQIDGIVSMVAIYSDVKSLEEVRQITTILDSNASLATVSPVAGNPLGLLLSLTNS